MEQEAKQILKQELKEQEFEDFRADEINWLEDEFYDSWDKVKGHWHNIVKPGSDIKFEADENPEIEKWFFLAHSKDMIEGKPQLVHDVMQKIPLIRLTSKINKEGTGRNKVEWKTPRYLFFDERYDKRYDGAMLDTFSKDFWIYKVKYDGKAYFVYSQEKLPEGKCRIKGMNIDFSDVSQMSDTLKVGSLSHVFMAKEAEPAVKTLSKKDLVEFTKSRDMNLEKWFCHLAQHPSGTINQFPLDVEVLRSAFLLSGKLEDGWPMHLSIFGPAGTRKTMGHGETIYSKFDEVMKMAAATSYRMKGLIPSYKKIPAEPGYLLQCHRIAIIDEIGKLIESEANRHDREGRNIMGEWNDILEWKHRSGGSGNDFIDIDPTAKVFIISNPVAGKSLMGDHVGLIDPTAMSRILWWVQDLEERELVMGKEGIIRNPPETLPSPAGSSPDTLTSLRVIENRKKEIVLKKCRGEVIGKEEFLTIFDSCNSFVSDISDEEVEKLEQTTIILAEGPMEDVWKPRAYHHIKLLIDGICKTRCLFDDYDSSFKAKKVDYDWAERILIRMINSWKVPLVKREWQGGSTLS